MFTKIMEAKKPVARYVHLETRFLLKLKTTWKQFIFLEFLFIPATCVERHLRAGMH